MRISPAKRLLFVDQYGDMGGGQRVLLSIVRVAVATGGTVTVLAPEGALREAVAKTFGGLVTYVPCDELRLTHGRKNLTDIFALLAYGWKFRRHLSLLHAQDLIYVNGLRHLPHLALLTLRMKAQVIYHVHLCHSWYERFMLRAACRLPNTFRVVMNSLFIKNFTALNPRYTRLVENALDEGFSALTYTDRFADKSTWNAVVLGTVRPEKGQDIAVAAVRSQPSMTLHLIGRPGEGAEAWIDKLRVVAPPNVHFHGPAEDPIKALTICDAQFNLVPSRCDEAFGLAAIEGMACSCLTIVSGRGGLAEIAEKTGALVAPNSADLTALLQNLTHRPKSELAMIAREQHGRTMTHYAASRFETEMGALLRQALGEEAVI